MSEYYILSFNLKNKDEAEIALESLRDADNIEIVDAAILSRSELGAIEYYETEDVTGPSGAAFGATVGAIEGALLGLMGGPGGVVVGAVVGAVAGGATGGVVAYQFDSAIPNEELEELANSLPNDSAALVALVEGKYRESVIDFMRNRVVGVYDMRVDDGVSSEIHNYRFDD